LRTRYRPFRLQDLVQSLRRGRIPHGVVVVTFDDGYADNLHAAKPLLERHDVPATIFLTTAYVRQNKEFWWDELERIFLQPSTLPDRLFVTVNGQSHQWDLKEARHYSEEEFRQHAWWTWRAKDYPTGRHRLFRDLFQLLQPLPEHERGPAITNVAAWAGIGSGVRPTHRPLASDEVVRLAESGLIEVGSHTVTHPLLPQLSAASQREELQTSKAFLETLTCKPITSFAYPFGASRRSETAALVREAGFESACSTIPDAVFRDTDLFQLPRLYVGNWGAEAFQKYLSRFF
jgi:peptidoglycan/xylan/chitin deacetylase (PgdA/CDA1 family)